MADIEHNPEIRRRAMSTFDVTRYVLQELFLPPIEEACQILLAEARSTEVLLWALGLLPPSPDSAATVPLTAI